MMANLYAAPVFGFLFGPVLGVMGLAFLLLVLVNRFACCHLKWTADEIRVHHSLGPIRWGAKAVPRHPSLYVRIRHRGIQGACLEIVTPQATLVVGAGVGARSRFTYDDLVALADRLDGILPPEEA